MKARFTKNCDFFTIEPKSDMRTSTLDFFTFFKRFAKEIEDAIPKVEKKRAGATSKPGGPGNAPAHHAELMRKLAEKNQQ